MLILLAVIIMMLWQGISIKERVSVIVKKELRQLDLLLLDDTVAWKGWQRVDKRWWRVYEFEFTSTAEERYSGTLRYMNRHQPILHLQPYRLERPSHEPLH